jgi:hypothetical protein
MKSATLMPLKVADYLAAEQRVGRLNQAIQPFNVAALLLGACFQYVFVQYFQGQDPFPVSEQAYVAGLVQTLLMGAAPQGKHQSNDL